MSPRRISNLHGPSGRVPAGADPRVQQFLNYTAGPVQRSLRMANSVCAEFQGDAASTVLAALLSEQCEVPLHLLWIPPGDVPRETTDHVRRVARLLHVPLVEIRQRDVANDPAWRAEALAGEAAQFTRRLLTLRGASAALAPRRGIPPSHLDAPDQALSGLQERFALQLRHPFEDENLGRFLRRDDPAVDDALLAQALARLGMPAPPAAPAQAPRYAGPTESL